MSADNILYIKGFLGSGTLPFRSSRSDARSGPERKEILGWLSTRGCILCRQEQKSLKRYFFWYLHEGYSQSENLERMERSGGFCRRHTIRLLAEGPSHTIASIYAPLLTWAAENLRQAENAISSKQHPESISADLAPKGACPACEAQERSGNYPLHLLRSTLHDVEVRDALAEASGICLFHLLKDIESFDWDRVCFLANEVAGKLRELDDRAISEGPDGRVKMLRGADLDEPYRGAGGLVGGVDRGETRAVDYPAGATWSPTVTELRRRLCEPGCFVCRAQRRALEAYLDWLSVEVRTRPTYQWSAALWLCRKHGWDFARRGSEVAVEMLVAATRNHWIASLENLTEVLHDKPPDELVLRVRQVPRRVWQSYPSLEEREHLTKSAGLGLALQNALAAAREALRAPGSILPELVEPVLRRHPCPACTYLETTAERNCDLLVRGLADPRTLRVYQESSGVCFLHLPKALSFCRGPNEAGALLLDQRVRVELLHWELEEYQRKQSWTIRYEPKGAEQDTWRRVASQFAGV